MGKCPAMTVAARIRGKSGVGFVLPLIVAACVATTLRAQDPVRPPAKPNAKAPTSKTKQKKTAPAKPVDELTRLREEFIKATKDYKANLERLRASYEKSVSRAETELAKSRELYSAGLVSKNVVTTNENEVAQAKAKVAEVDAQMTNADAQIADTLLEADAEAKLARSKPLPRGGLVKSAAFIRFNGGASWLLSDAWKVQSFFQNTFKHPLPVSVFGQGAIHDKWRLDHHNAMDVSLQPDSNEGQALLAFLRANGIPFLAFRAAIPGTATGPHIHIGRPSHRY